MWTAPVDKQFFDVKRWVGLRSYVRPVARSLSPLALMRSDGEGSYQRHEL